MDENPTNPNNTPDISNPGEDIQSEPMVAPEEVNEMTDSPEPEVAPVPEPTPEPTPAPEPSPVPVQPVMQPEPKKKSHAGIIIAIIIIIALIAAGAVVCLMLINNNAGKDEAPKTPETPVEEPVEQPEKKESNISTISCIAGDETNYTYTAEIDVDNKELKGVEIRQTLELMAGYDANNVAEEHQLNLAGLAMSLQLFQDIDDEGLVVTEEGDQDSGEGYTISAQIIREKAKNEELLSMFEDVDGLTADELMAKTLESDDAKMFTCEVK